MAHRGHPSSVEEIVVWLRNGNESRISEYETWFSEGEIVYAVQVTRRLAFLSAHFIVTCMWHGTSHACYETVESTATMRVQNYAGSRIKRGSCRKCFSGWHGDLCALFVQQLDNISADTERRAGLSAIAEPLVIVTYCSKY